MNDFTFLKCLKEGPSVKVFFVVCLFVFTNLELNQASYPHVLTFSCWEHWVLFFPQVQHFGDSLRQVSFPFFFLSFLLFFNFTILYWFCHISTWIHHSYTRVPHPEPSSLLPPRTIPLGRPSAPAPSIQYRASNLDWRFVSYMILYIFQCHSPKSSHPLPLPQSPKDCSVHQCLFCCLVHRVIVTIFLNSIYMH